jgi:hypothetical protein
MSCHKYGIPKPSLVVVNILDYFLQKSWHAIDSINDCSIAMCHASSHNLYYLFIEGIIRHVIHQEELWNRGMSHVN